MEIIFLIILVVVVIYYKRQKSKNSADEISVSINLPDKGRPGTISEGQNRFLNEWGFSGFSDISKQQASILISCIRYSERVCEILNQKEKLKSTYMLTLITFICNDESFRTYVHERNTQLWKEGIDEDDVEPDKNNHFFKLKEFIEQYGE